MSQTQMSHPDFGPSCPTSGQWYACGNATNFVGCCDVYACTSIGCPDDSLQPASFAASNYGTFPDQECDAGKFYTCQSNVSSSTSFLGCCESNPCGSPIECPVGDLATGRLSKNVTAASEYDPQPPLSGGSSTDPSTTSGSPSQSASPSDTGGGTDADDNSSSPSTTRSSTPTGAIVGGTIGGVAFLALLGIALFFLARRRRRTHHQAPQAASASANPSAQTTPFTPYTPYTDASSPYSPRNDEKRDVYGSNTPATQPQELHDEPVPPQELASREVVGSSKPPAYRSQDMAELSAQGETEQRAAGGKAGAGLGIQGRSV